MKRSRLWWLNQLVASDTPDCIWDNEPTLIWPNWVPPINTYTVPGPHVIPPEKMARFEKAMPNPMGIGSGLPIGLETPRIRLTEPWSPKASPSFNLIGGRKLSFVPEPIWRLLEELAPRDVEGIKAEVTDSRGAPCPPHWVCDFITFRHLASPSFGQFLRHSPDDAHEDLGDAKIFRSYTSMAIFCTDEVRERMKKPVMHLSRWEETGEFVDA